MKYHLSLILLCVMISIPLAAQQESEKKEVKPVPESKSFVTLHKGTYNGVAISFKATAKETYLKNEKDEPVASIWSVTYTQTGVTDLTKRPVTFIFNGGPGSASI